MFSLQSSSIVGLPHFIRHIVDQIVYSSFPLSTVSLPILFKSPNSQNHQLASKMQSFIEVSVNNQQVEKEKWPIDFVRGIKVAVYWRELVGQLVMLFFGQRRQ